MLPNIFRELDDKNNFFLIAGPCVVENQSVCFEVAEYVKSICEKLHIPFIFKSSYKKANRSSIHSFTGIGDEKALQILARVREQFNVPILTDVHSVEEVKLASDYVDVLQIPAFLCRQTELLDAAGKSGLSVNIKKGQFLAPEAMHHAVKKVEETGNRNIMVTERGFSFGYGDLIVDFRSVPVMKKMNYPVIVDCTHSNQKPNQPSGITGGKPEFIDTIARAAIAVGADGLFLETHPDPGKALSDGANMLELGELDSMMQRLVRIRNSI
ncbi:3-deoxy-8-phosphooctulonate synthase [Membranihabitans maritimus]|uniref:3-deoxy-8-phosphooctulonate synthase n=1 Tax=Membranihabitans maritimus TaxID=2904244 RepID=UPI001F0192EA|nr:3-deoxy-8-phosphooctulonate synthase [Membranihabitans maritimus]